MNIEIRKKISSFRSEKMKVKAKKKKKTQRINTMYTGN